MTVYVADFGSQNPVNFVKLGKSGCVGVILRATRSNEKDDALYPSRRELARNNGLLTAAYAFNTGEPPVVQVKRFLAWANLESDEAGYLDLERNPSGTGQMTLNMTAEWLDRADQARGRYCGLYSGDVIKTLIPGDPRRGTKPATDAQREFLAKHPLWGCEYGPRWRNVDANHVELPWAKPFLWQCTSDGIGPEPHTMDGLEPGADLSVFDGTAEELRAQWALPAIPGDLV
jgi:GH25 family lysozyme M1 (1,4-beta-N-acetylmuramidase)